MTQDDEPDMEGTYLEFDEIEIWACEDHSHIHVVLHDGQELLLNFALTEEEFNLIVQKCKELRGWGASKN